MATTSREVVGPTRGCGDRKVAAVNESLNSKLGRLTDELIASYDNDTRTQRIGERFQPSRSGIVEALELTRQLLFPGFLGRKELTGENIRSYVGNLLTTVAEKLTDQICHCLCMHGSCDRSGDTIACRPRAQRLSGQFLERIPTIREALALDVQAAYDGDPAAQNTDEIIYCYPGFYAVTVYRIAHELLKLGVPLMPRIMTEHAHRITGTDIHPGSEIGKSFFIDHATGVVIGETTKIGDNVKVYQGVTLGAMSFPKDRRGRVIKGYKRHPTIEDDVTIYANATILGGDTVIAKGVTVAGNTFVTHSITADSVVAAKTPALRVIPKQRQEP